MASASHLHQLLAKKLVRNIKVLKAAWKTTSQSLQSRLPAAFRLEPIPVRASQPLHRIAALKQARSRWYTTQSTRHFSTTPTTTAAKSRSTPKSSWPQSSTRIAVTALTSRAPFASTLRPNLTGGALPRSAGGYGLGNGGVKGARYFSHTPAAPAQVVQNVSQAVRAFLVSGQKAQFAGTDARGGKQYRTVSALQDSTTRRMQAMPKMTPGSYIDFAVNPTITALTPLEAVAGYAGFSSVEDCTAPTEAARSINHFDINLNTPSLLDILSADFSRALKDLAAILNDLKALSSLGDLPITYRAESGVSTLRIHFPGCDAMTVENLCRELDVKRGIVVQDADFDAFAGTEIALLFPFAPSEGSLISEEPIQHHIPMKPTLRREDAFVWRDDPLFPDEEDEEMSELYSTQSDTGMEFFDYADSVEEVVLSSPEANDMDSRRSSMPHSRSGSMSEVESPLEYQDFEGIYRFIEMCDDSRR